MKFLADENMPGDAVEALRAAGYDVVWIKESSPGITDAEILSQAVQQGRLLLTFDKDFGELAFNARLPATCGIILFRLPMPDAASAGSLLKSLVSSRDDWVGRFSVIEIDRIRMRDLPGEP